MDAQFCGVEIEDGVAVHQLPAEGVIAAHGVDFLPGILGHVGHLMEHRMSPQSQIPAADIQAGHQKVAAGGGLGQVDDLPHIAGVDLGPHQQQA